MIVQGSISPLQLWIRYIDENNNTVVRLVRNVIEKDVTDEIIKDTQKVYEYEEIEMSIPNRNNLEQYIIDNFDLLFEKGLSDYELKKQLEEKEKQIKDLIDNHKLLEVNQQLQSNINSLTDTLVELSLNISTS
jgi:mevalonate kinase